MGVHYYKNGAKKETWNGSQIESFVGEDGSI